MLIFIDRQFDLIEYSHCHLKFKNKLQYRYTYDFNLKMLFIIELPKNATGCITDAYKSRLRDCTWMPFTEFRKKKRAIIGYISFPID